MMNYHYMYSTWIDMRERCNNSYDKDYRNYGGRGIKVCHRWESNFHDFVSDMGERPSGYHMLSRIDCTGDYSPENCRWATHEEFPDVLEPYKRETC